MRKSYFVLLFCIFSTFMFAADATIEALAEKAMISFDNEEFTAEGGLRVKYDGNIEIQANRVKKVKDKNVLIAYDKVIFKQGDKTVECDTVELNLDDKSAKIDNARSFSDKIYYGGAKFEAKFEEKEASVNNCYFSTCSDKEQHYHLAASKIDFSLGKRLIAYNVVIYVGKIPVFWLPLYITSVKDGSGDRAALFPVYKYEEKLGHMVVWGVDYDIIKDKLWGFLDLEWSSKKGLNINRWVNTYEIAKDNGGTLKIEPFRIDKNIGYKPDELEWAAYYNHKLLNKGNGKDFFGDANWDINGSYKHNVGLYKEDGTLLNENIKNLQLTIVEGSIAQKLGTDMNATGKIKWTSDTKLVKQLAESTTTTTVPGIDVPPSKLEKIQEATFEHNNSFDRVALRYKDNLDINPGNQGDTYSFDRERGMEVGLKSILNSPLNITVRYTNKERDSFKDFTYVTGTAISTTAAGVTTSTGIGASTTGSGLETKKFSLPVDEMDKLESYGVNIGNITIPYTKFFIGFDYSQNDKEKITREYIADRVTNNLISSTPEKDKDYIIPKTDVGATKDRTSVYTFGNSDIDTILFGNFKSDGKYTEEVHSDQNGYVVFKYNLNPSLTTTLYDVRNDEFSDYDLTVKNTIPYTYYWEDTTDISKKTPADTNYNIGDSISATLGNITGTYTFKYGAGLDGKSEWYKRRGQTTLTAIATTTGTAMVNKIPDTWVKTESTDHTIEGNVAGGDTFRTNIKNTITRAEYFDFISDIKNDFGIEIGIKENQNKVSFTRSESKGFYRTTTSGISSNDRGITTDDKYTYSNSRLGITYGKKDSYLNDTTSGKRSADFTDNSYTLLFKNQNSIYPQDYNFTLTNGEDRFLNVRKPKTIALTINVEDRSELPEAVENKVEEKDRNKFEYIAKAKKEDDGKYKLFKEDEKEIDDILKQEERNKNPPPAPLIGIGEEKKTTVTLQKIKKYSLTLGFTSDEEYRATTAAGIKSMFEQYDKSITDLNASTTYQYSNLFSITAGLIYKKPAGGFFTSKTNKQSVTVFFGEVPYEWTLTYTREYDNLAGKDTLNDVSLKHSVHCTSWELFYKQTYTTADDGRYPWTAGIKFSINAFPDKNLIYENMERATDFKERDQKVRAGI